MEVDEVFRHIGELGPEQVKLFVLLSLPTAWDALHVLITNFIGTDPGWSCTISSAQNCHTFGSSEACKKNLSVLITDPEKKCMFYEKGACDPQFNIGYTSIVTEWELICSKSSYPNLSQSGLFLGLMIGAWVFGILTDMYGRRLIVFIGLLGCVLTAIGYGLSTGFFMFAVFRILFGMMHQATVVARFSLFMEIVGMSKRSFVAMANQMFFSVGTCALVVLAYFIRSWRALCLVNALMGFTLLTMWRLIPESPRWLLIQGRENEAKAVLAKIARGNGTNMTISKLKKPASPPSDGGLSTVNLFRGDVIRKRTLILLVAWFTNCVVYYGLSLNAGNLGGGRYFSVVLSGVVEIPGLYISYQLLNRIGRKWSHGGLLMLGGMCCTLWALGHWADFGESVKLVLALVGKCAVAGSFSVIYLYSAELFPTEVRSLGLGVVSVASRIGGIVSPLILLLSSMSVGLPMLVMGGLGLMAGFLTLSLPETLNHPLPETLAELNTH